MKQKVFIGIAVVVIASILVLLAHRQHFRSPVSKQYGAIGASSSNVFSEFKKAGDLPGGHVSDIAIAPSHPETVYLASNVNGMGIWKSDDTGETWRRVYYQGNFGGTHVTAIAVHPKNHNVVLAVDIHGRISKTSDGGKNWRFVRGNKGAPTDEVPPLFAIAISPSEPNVVYAGNVSGRIFKSTDTGETWLPLQAVVNPKGIGSLAVNPQNSNILYAGSHQEIFKSVDGGKSWRLSSNPFDAVAITIPSKTPEAVWAATRNGVFRSRDAGGHWERLLPQHAHSIQIALSNPKIAYAGTTQGVYKTTDGGKIWKQLSKGIVYTDMGPLTIHPKNPDVVLAGNNIWFWQFHHDDLPQIAPGEGVYKTTNGGLTWSNTAKSGGFVDTDVAAIAVDPANPDVAYVGTECSRGIYATENGGAVWNFISGGPKNSPDIAHYTMRLATDQKSNVYLTGRFGITKSGDHGRNWSTTAVRRHFHGMGISPHDPNLIFTGTSPAVDGDDAPTPGGPPRGAYPGARILRSTDGGVSWQEVGQGGGFPSGAHTSIHDFAFDPSDPNVVYVSTTREETLLPRTKESFGIFKSADRGEHWRAINEGLPVPDVDAVATSAAAPGLAFAGTEKGVYRSEDGGEHWVATTVAAPVESFVVDPTNPSTVIAGTGSGLFMSLDAGVNWQEVTQFHDKKVAGVAMDKGGRVLYAAVTGLGVFKAVKK